MVGDRHDVDEFIKRDSQVVRHQAHNLKIRGSIPLPATGVIFRGRLSRRGGTGIRTALRLRVMGVRLPPPVLLTFRRCPFITALFGQFLRSACLCSSMD